MWIHLLRHGIAIDRDDPACPTDPERFLTDQGKARTKAVARGLARLEVEIDVVLSSPYVRALQTAEIARRVLAPEAPLSTTDALVPHADPAALGEALREHAGSNLLCVGHAPQLDRLLAWLVGVDEPFTALKKAGLASLEVRRGTAGRRSARLVALYPPAVLRKLADEAS